MCISANPQKSAPQVSSTLHIETPNPRLRQLSLKPCDGQPQHNTSNPAREEGTSIAPGWKGDAILLCVYVGTLLVQLTNAENSVISALVVLLVRNT